jgi:hypothetical protein
LPLPYRENFPKVPWPAVLSVEEIGIFYAGLPATRPPARINQYSDEANIAYNYGSRLVSRADFAGSFSLNTMEASDASFHGSIGRV